MFAKYDEDSNGLVDLEEFTALLFTEDVLVNSKDGESSAGWFAWLE